MHQRIKYLFTALILSQISSTCLGQAVQKIDSLTIALKEHPINDSSRADLLNQIGFEYWTVDPKMSETFGQEAKTLAEKLNYLSGIAMANRVIGVSYWSRGDFFKSLTYLFESREVYKQIHDQLGEANSTMNIGLIYEDQKDYGRALENFQYAIQLFEKENRLDRIGITYNKIGTVYLEKGDFTKSRQYLSKAYEIHQKNNFSFGIMETSNRLGLLYREEGNYESAKEYLSRSLNLAKINKDQEHIIKNLENLASIAILENHFDQAKKYLDQTLPMAKTHHYLKWLGDIYKDYHEIYFARNNFQQALFYYEQHEIIKDSIFSQDKATQIANLELEYQTTQHQQALRLREQQVLLLQQQNKTDRIINIVLISSIAFLMIVGVYVFRNQRIKFKQKQIIADRDAQLTQSELENIRLSEKELNQTLDFKNKELTSYTVNFIRKNELIENLKDTINKLQQDHPEQAREFNSLSSLVQQNSSIDRDWEDFKRTFENVHHHFFSRLLKYNPELTQAELRLCALVCLNLTVKEMSSLMGISPDSAKTARYRLRKKLNLNQDQNLTEFVIGLTKG
jgi:tetratricopeptide (TPR) repeat protein